MPSRGLCLTLVGVHYSVWAVKFGADILKWPQHKNRQECKQALIIVLSCLCLLELLTNSLMCIFSNIWACLCSLSEILPPVHHLAWFKCDWLMWLDHLCEDRPYKRPCRCTPVWAWVWQKGLITVIYVFILKGMWRLGYIEICVNICEAVVQSSVGDQKLGGSDYFWMFDDTLIIYLPWLFLIEVILKHVSI